MIEQAAVFFLTLFLSPGERTPFKLQLQMIIFIFFYCGDGTPVFSRDADQIFSIYFYNSKNMPWIVVESDGHCIDELAAVVQIRTDIGIPTLQVLPIKKKLPFVFYICFCKSKAENTNRCGKKIFYRFHFIRNVSKSKINQFGITLTKIRFPYMSTKKKTEIDSLQGGLGLMIF